MARFTLSLVGLVCTVGYYVLLALHLYVGWLRSTVGETENVGLWPANFPSCSCWVTITVGKPSATDQPTRPTQPFVLLGSINRVPDLIGWGKGGNVTSAEWQVTLSDPIWHVSSRSSEVFANCYTRLLKLLYLLSFQLTNVRYLQRTLKPVNYMCNMR